MRTRNKNLGILQEEDVGSFGAVFEHQAAAGILGHFAVLGVTPIDGLTIESIRSAYRSTARHVFRSGLLPRTKGPNVPIAAQVDAAMKELVNSQKGLNRLTRILRRSPWGLKGTPTPLHHSQFRKNLDP